MKLLFICPYLPVQGMHAGGGRMFSLIKEHSKRHSIYVISFVTEDDMAHIGELETYCNEVITVGRHHNTVIKWPSLVPFVIREQYESEEMHSKISAFMATHEIDIVTVEYLVMAGYLPPQCRSVLVIYEMMSLAAMREWMYKRLAQKIPFLLSILKALVFEAKIFKRYDRLVALTEREKKLINFLSPSSAVKIIPPGANSSYFHPRYDTEETSEFVFVGNFFHPPNRDAMEYFCFQIYPLIKREIPDVRLTIVGYKSDEFLSSLKSCGGVTITGRVGDIRPYLAGSKIFINPVRLGGGIRCKVLEAFAMAKPVISTSVGAEGWDAKNGESIVIADTPVEFARKAIALLRSKDMRQRIGSRAYDLFKEKYDWSRAVKKMEKLYEEIAAKKQGRGARVT